MITFLIIGFISGIISGIGIGGGINLIYFIPTALCAIIIHIKNKNIDKEIFLRMIFTAILGSIFGSIIAIKIEADILKKIFGFFLLAISFYELKCLQK